MTLTALQILERLFGGIGRRGDSMAHYKEGGGRENRKRTREDYDGTCTQSQYTRLATQCDNGVASMW